MRRAHGSRCTPMFLKARLSTSCFTTGVKIIFCESTSVFSASSTRQLPDGLHDQMLRNSHSLHSRQRTCCGGAGPPSRVANTDNATARTSDSVLGGAPGEHRQTSDCTKERNAPRWRKSNNCLGLKPTRQWACVPINLSCAMLSISYNVSHAVSSVPTKAPLANSTRTKKTTLQTAMDSACPLANVSRPWHEGCDIDVSISGNSTRIDIQLASNPCALVTG